MTNQLQLPIDLNAVDVVQLGEWHIAVVKRGGQHFVSVLA